MKTHMILALFSLVSCSSNITKNPTREIASVNSIIRFFETKVEENELPSKLACEQNTCRYVEVEIQNNFLNIRSCTIDKDKLFYAIDPTQAVLEKKLDAKCKSFLSNYEITPSVLNSLESQLSNDKIKGRNTFELIKTGTFAVGSGVSAILMGGLTVISAIDPVLPLFIITGPGTIMYSKAAYDHGRDFVTEFKGQPRVIYKSGSAEKILSSIENGGVSTFYIASRIEGFLSFHSSNSFDRFNKAWKSYAKDLEKLQNEETVESFSKSIFNFRPM